MKLLNNFEINPNSKLIWVSEKAKSVWKPIIDVLNEKIQKLEIDSVIQGHRECAWRTMRVTELLEFTQKCGVHGLIVLPVTLVGSWEGFAHRVMPYEEGKPMSVSCIISRSMKSALIFK